MKDDALALVDRPERNEYLGRVHPADADQMFDGIQFQSALGEITTTSCLRLAIDAGVARRYVRRYQHRG